MMMVKMLLELMPAPSISQIEWKKMKLSLRMKRRARSLNSLTIPALIGSITATCRSSSSRWTRSGVISIWMERIRSRSWIWARARHQWLRCLLYRWMWHIVTIVLFLFPALTRMTARPWTIELTHLTTPGFQTFCPKTFLWAATHQTSWRVVQHLFAPCVHHRIICRLWIASYKA